MTIVAAVVMAVVGLLVGEGVVLSVVWLINSLSSLDIAYWIPGVFVFVLWILVVTAWFLIVAKAGKEIAEMDKENKKMEEENRRRRQELMESIERKRGR
ncbi:hypothetical protein [Salibacterium lacus]|uniref:Uncharacterized protein n=1 Tax=Salibacterium lacus TaxID=1898109 RepID=A0ABW5SWS5_9BACI